MIMEITCGADPTIVVRKQVTEETVLPTGSAGLGIKFIPEENDPPEVTAKLSRKDRKKKTTVKADPLEGLNEA